MLIQYDNNFRSCSQRRYLLRVANPATMPSVITMLTVLATSKLLFGLVLPLVLTETIVPLILFPTRVLSLAFYGHVWCGESPALPGRKMKNDARMARGSFDQSPGHWYHWYQRQLTERRARGSQAWFATANSSSSEKYFEAPN